MPKASTSKSREPAAAPTSKKASSRDTELMREEHSRADRDEDDDDNEEAEEDDVGTARTGNATTIAETQFDDDAETAPLKGTKSSSSSSLSKRNNGKKQSAAAAATESNPPANKRKAPESVPGFDRDDARSDEDMTPREKKLKRQLEAKDRALTEVTTQFRKLSELRHTRAEESEMRLKAIADERQTASANTIAAYKKEADALRAENSSLETTAYASPRSKQAQAVDRRVKELEAEQSDLAARVRELEHEAEERERYWRDKLAQEATARETVWNEEKERLTADLATAQQDLETEVAHSKSLQAKLKSVGPTLSSSSITTTPATAPGLNPSAGITAAVSSSSSAAGAKVAQLTEERDSAIRKLQLNEDLTGFMVNSVRGTDEPSYVCSLTDCWGTEEKSLNFKIVFYRDQTVGYTPDLQPERDTLLSQILPPELQSYARFDAERSGEWFKRLYTAVNKRR
ncbi:hypothetical protein JCM3766R1_000119 [Sporobolomyces carnicolor]